jgi:hypothetical protein
MTLNAAYGKVTFATMTGLTVVSGANGTASVTVKGTLASLNSALNGLVFTPTAGYAGAAAALFFSITDLGDGLTGTAAIGISVYAPPKFSGPTSASVTVNSSLVFSTAGNNAIGIVDAAGAKGGNVQLTLTAGHGTLTLATTAGLSFTAGANHTASMTIVGSLNSNLAALNGLRYTPTARYIGTASIKMTAKDLLDGLSGSSTIALQVTRLAAIKAVAVHHSPAPSVRHSSPTSPQVLHSGTIEGSTAFAGGAFLIDEPNYWAGIVAAIEWMNRP